MCACACKCMCTRLCGRVHIHRLCIEQYEETVVRCSDFMGCTLIMCVTIIRCVTIVVCYYNYVCYYSYVTVLKVSSILAGVTNKRFHCASLCIQTSIFHSHLQWLCAPRCL